MPPMPPVKAEPAAPAPLAIHSPVTVPGMRPHREPTALPPVVSLPAETPVVPAGRAVVVPAQPAMDPDLQPHADALKKGLAPSQRALAARAMSGGRHASTGSDGHLALDAVCRAELGDRGLVESGRQASSLAPDTSLAFFVGGSGTEFTDVLRAAAAFPPEVRRFAIVVAPEGNSRVTETGGLPVLHLAAKEDLGGLLRWSVR